VDGIATISWTVCWKEDGGSGQSGTFSDISATDTVDRQVDEVQGVVVGGST
jgi:hypothetical protein